INVARSSVQAGNQFIVNAEVDIMIAVRLLPFGGVLVAVNEANVMYQEYLVDRSEENDEVFRTAYVGRNKQFVGNIGSDKAIGCDGVEKPRFINSFNDSIPFPLVKPLLLEHNLRCAAGVCAHFGPFAAAGNDRYDKNSVKETPHSIVTCQGGRYCRPSTKYISMSPLFFAAISPR